MSRFWGTESSDEDDKDIESKNGSEDDEEVDRENESDDESENEDEPDDSILGREHFYDFLHITKENKPLAAQTSTQAQARRRRSGTPLSFPEKVTLPSIVLDDDMSSDILKDFYLSATEQITFPLRLHPKKKKDIRSLRILKGDAKPSSKFLMFVPIEDAEKKSHIILRAKDLYKVGYEIVGHHYILDFENPKDGDDVLEALLTLGFESDHTSNVDVRVDYPDLESLIPKQRHELELGRGSLLKHFKLLFVKDLNEDRPLAAQVVLFFSQIICEALRIYEMRDHILSSFLEGTDNIGVKTPINLVLLQHGWGTASNRLQREAWGLDGFEVRIKVDDDVIEVQSLFSMFTCLRSYGKDYLQRNLELAEKDKVMAVKYGLSEESRERKLALNEG